VLRDVTGQAYHYSLDQVMTVELAGQVLHSETVNLARQAPKTLLIATRNEGKTREFKALFSQLGYEIKNLNDFPELPDVAETGMTFEENARLKAETISELTGEIVLADDSGLMVDVLGGLPGVWSARFAGDHATDAANNAKLLHELASTAISPEKRKAKFHTTLVVAAPEKDSLVVEGEWPGAIATIPKGEDGFGYDPLFVDEATGRTAAQMTLEQKNQVSHRARALKNLLKKWPEWLRQ
jgi:XTP/dITP diphosphohydrolase